MSCWSVNPFEFTLEQLHSCWSARAMFSAQNRTNQEINKTCFFYTTSFVSKYKIETVPVEIKDFNFQLTHLPLMPHICASEWGSAFVQIIICRLFGPSHELNQRWVIVNWTIRNKLLSKFKMFHSRIVTNLPDNDAVKFRCNFAKW